MSRQTHERPLSRACRNLEASASAALSAAATLLGSNLLRRAAFSRSASTRACSCASLLAWCAPCSELAEASKTTRLTWSKSTDSMPALALVKTVP